MINTTTQYGCGKECGRGNDDFTGEGCLGGRYPSDYSYGYAFASEVEHEDCSGNSVFNGDAIHNNVGLGCGCGGGGTRHNAGYDVF